MQIAMVAKLRSGPLYNYRQRNSIATDGRPLSVQASATSLELPVETWYRIERLDFRSVSWVRVKEFAAALDVLPEDICPEEFIRQNLHLERVVTREIDARLLVATRTRERMILPSPDDLIEDEQIVNRDFIAAALEQLTYREREVLKLRYGIGDNSSHTLEEVSKVFRVTRERIRQVEIKAIRKLQLKNQVSTRGRGLATKENTNDPTSATNS